MNRRRFLAAILAAGTAPLVLRSGIARGILMPARHRRIPGRVDIFSAGGILLVSVPYGTDNDSGGIQYSGTVAYSRVHGVPGVPDGYQTNEIAFSSDQLLAGCIMTIRNLHFYPAVGN